MGRENFAAAFTVSVDLPGHAEPGHAAGQFGAILDDMLALFDEFKVPAVWGISHPAASPWAGSIRRRGVAHEIALLGDSSWLTPHQPRLAQEAGRRIESAASMGIRIGSLLLRGTSIPSDLDTFVRHRVTLVRGDIRSHWRSKMPFAIRPLSARQGVWQVPSSAVIVGRRSFWPGAEAGTAVRALQEAMHVGGLFHLAIDLAGAASESVPVIGAVRRILRAADGGRKKAGLLIESLTTASARYLAQAAPAQSVLRRAA